MLINQIVPVFNLQVTKPELDLLVKYLGRAPYDEIAPLLGKIVLQVNSQVQADTQAHQSGASGD